MTCQHTMTLGVYLLGALEPAERYAFESHLSYCDICRGELVRLAPLPGLLNQISPEDFADSMPPTGAEGMSVATRAQPVTEPVPLPFELSEPEVGHAPAPEKARPRNKRRNKPSTRLNDRPTGGRRDGGRPGGRPPRRYWRIAAAAAVVVVLAVAGIFGWQATHEETASPVAQSVTWSAADGAATVDARLVDHEWGTEIQSTIHGLPPGRKCYLFVYDHYGNRQVAGWWGTDHDPNEEIPASTSIMRSKIDRLVYMLDDKETVAFTIEAPH